MSEPEFTSADVADVEARYHRERDKRIAAGGREYRSLDDRNLSFDADPFSEPFERDPRAESTEVLIVGAGWAGMCTAAYLTKQGVTDYRIVDKAGDFGGTWYWNRYPGCMCDVESYTYLPLLEEVGYMPTKRYAHAQEIFEYAQKLGRHFDMYRNAVFQTEITAMEWDEAVSRWQVTTNRGDVFSARFVVICGGLLHKAKLPGIDGIEDFQGHSFHTSRWDYGFTGGAPDVPMDQLHDKAVAIIGTGATAIQVVPKLAAAAKSLHVFQRTPSIVGVRGQRETDPEWFAEITAKPGWQQERQDNFVATTIGEAPEVDLIQDGWTEMFAVDIRKLPADQAEAEALKAHDLQLMTGVRQRIADIVEDPATAAALQPWYGVGCKRPCYHDDYLPTFNRSNVTLVDTRGYGVEKITERGIVANGVEYPVDVIVYASGFEAPGTFYTHRLGFDPVGKGGEPLSEAWAKGAWTLHGIWTHDFPNFAMNSHIQNGAHINFAYPATKTAEHTAYAIKQALDEQVLIEPDKQAEAAWFRIVVSTVGGYSSYMSACTPGYQNNELQMPDERDMRSACYLRSPVELRDLLADWRADGEMKGLVKTPLPA